MKVRFKARVRIRVRSGFDRSADAHAVTHHSLHSSPVTPVTKLTMPLKRPLTMVSATTCPSGVVYVKCLSLQLPCAMHISSCLCLDMCLRLWLRASIAMRPPSRGNVITHLLLSIEAWSVGCSVWQCLANQHVAAAHSPVEHSLMALVQRSGHNRLTALPPAAARCSEARAW